MATYYVRPDGSNSNTGLGSTASQAWQTITYALANMVLTAGDNYLYIAPGVYRESPTVTITPTSSNRLIISGNPTASQFTTMTAGNVRLTGATSDINAISASANRLNLNGKSYITVENLFIEHNAAGGTYAINFAPTGLSGTDITIRKNVIFSHYLGGAVGGSILVSTTSLTTGNSILIDSNIIFGCAFGIAVNLQAQTGATGHSGVVISNNRIHGNGWQNMFLVYVSTNVTSNTASNSLTISNCIVMQSNGNGIQLGGGNTTTPHLVQNCIVALCATGIYSAFNSSTVIQRNNLLHCGSNLATVNSDASTITSDHYGIDLGQALLQGFGAVPFGTTLGSRNTSFGFTTSSPTTDMYGFPWSGTSPDVGTTTYRSLTSIGTFVPSERNPSSYTITAGSVQQSFEIYLGVTGLTSASTGLRAYYNKSRTADVEIPLVARTISQPWISGGFAEVNPLTMPGVYRIDIPNEAISIGYDITTVIVRGASGTNGAVMTIQEPQASASQVRMGPFTVQADGVLTDERLKLFKGSIHSIDFKMVDQYGTGVDGTGTVVTANAYNSAGFLVDSYPCTAKYAEDGRYSFAIDATVTNVVGMYTINISRQIGSEINVFGRMKLEVLSP